MSSKSQISWGLFMLLFLLCTSVLSVSATFDFQKTELNSLSPGLVSNICVKRYPQPITRELMIKEATSALYSFGGRKKMPCVASALWAGGDKIIFAIPAKGKGTVPGNEEDNLQIPAPAQDILKECAAKFGTHNFDGKCGEIMVIAEWLRENPGKTLPQEKMIVAVKRQGVVSPCQKGDQEIKKGGSTYGCAQFLEAMGFKDEEIIKKDDACKTAPPGSPKESEKRACAKPAPRRQAARPVSRRPRQRRSVHPRWNEWMAQ